MRTASQPFRTAAALCLLTSFGLAQVQETGQHLSVVGSVKPGQKITVVAENFTPYSQMLLFAGLSPSPQNIGFVTLDVAPVVAMDSMGVSDPAGRAAKRYQLPAVFPPAIGGLTVHLQAVGIGMPPSATYGSWLVEKSGVASMTFDPQ